MSDKLIKIPGLPGGWVFTQHEIDIIKAYEPPKEKLYIHSVEGECIFDKTGNYLILTGSMLESAKSTILFNHANKVNN